MDIAGFEPVSIHWHPAPWPSNASREYVTTAMQCNLRPEHRGVKMPLCLDIEPWQMWWAEDKEWQKWHNIQLGAMQDIRREFPGWPVWSYDVSGGQDDKDAIARVCACRQVLDNTAASGHGGYYLDRAGVLHRDRAKFLSDAHRRIGRLCSPMTQNIAFVSWRLGGGSTVIAERDAYMDSVKAARDDGNDIIAVFQSDWYFEGWNEDIARDRLSRGLDWTRKALAV